MDNSEFSSMINKTVECNRGKGVDKLLKTLKSKVKSWISNVKVKEEDQIGVIEANIAKLESDLLTTNTKDLILSELGILKSRLWALYRKEEREWIQKSRLKWFNEGDKNTRFFHFVASMRSRINNISMLKVGNVAIEDATIISKQFEQFFRKAFNCSNTIPVKNLCGGFKKLNEDFALRLEGPFTQDEVWSVISSSDGPRAPGPDGFSLDFFKRYWRVLKADVMELFNEFFECNLSVERINQSFITLIPKVSAPENVEVYRPICLVGSLYKILAKVLAKRLAGVLKEVIGETQFAFLTGRQIVDCSLIANETINFIQKNKSNAILFKADFKKAYDSVDWNFLDLIQKEMGFGCKWRKWVNMCISSANVVILINGVPSNSFTISRSLRQV
ncbi:hypothetical protein HRI_003497300 [Hibiscus trionum]|uniref:Reverse transcriptase domain-containing protein n=1 Tax=Hibiscus trionum TaxID=183268 RepID=A0A9W7ILF4_HIBTR|nr:hypothetical protein HRI_003497300 [Hibiscus trionum]